MALENKIRVYAIPHEFFREDVEERNHHPVKTNYRWYHPLINFFKLSFNTN